MIVDQKGRASLDPNTRDQAFRTVSQAGGAITLQPGLYGASRQRANLAKRIGRWLTGANSDDKQQQVTGMGLDTNIITFDAVAFNKLSSSMSLFAQTNDADQLLAMLSPLSESAQTAIEEIIAFNNAAALVRRRDPRSNGIGARLFYELCSPAQLSFTSSSFVNCVFANSQYVRELFTVGGLDGESMNLYLGEGTLLKPDIAKKMWTAIKDSLPADLSSFYGPEVADLLLLDQTIDSISYTNVAIGFFEFGCWGANGRLCCAVGQRRPLRTQIEFPDTDVEQLFPLRESLGIVGSTPKHVFRETPDTTLAALPVREQII